MVTRDKLTQDAAVQKAAATLREHFTNKIGQPIQTPFYITQLQVLYETDYFPWVLTDAIRLLLQEKFLVEITKADITVSPDDLPNLRDIHFVLRTEVYKANPELTKTHAFNTAKLVNEYSEEKNSKALGKHLEGLVKYELRANRFKIVGSHTNQHNGIQWEQTGHNLDFIAEHESGKLDIGVEVKNTLDIMEPYEIDTKIDMCHHLGLVPIFAVRWIKPYMDCISNQGGFSWIFKTQMYPPGRENFVSELYKRLSVENRADSKGHKLEFPVIVRTEIPDKSASAFSRWINNAIVNPPQRNPEARCGSTEQDEETLPDNEISEAEIYVGP